MQGNRSRDTRPELALRRALHALGLRYRVCTRPLPNVRRTADVVFPSARVAVEVRGCFWHGCVDHYKQPRTNSGYWANKIQQNLRRDEDLARTLQDAGWALEVVWEHEDATTAAVRVAAIVHERRIAARRVSSTRNQPGKAPRSGTETSANGLHERERPSM
ncbi:very short patch repair endonuclease [Actinophytocola xanthii]|uniref:Very short patch repair endonuclease n=2 Tax=Actinophytocola xanthii TaxID=1912961 RepID=A0A1Q8CRU7_9PSEU|nr:very short patch repair endonuclease [Actinophytocola xanthii]